MSLFNSNIFNYLKSYPISPYLSTTMLEFATRIFWISNWDRFLELSAEALFLLEVEKDSV